MPRKVLHLTAILFLTGNVGFSAAECNGVPSACDPEDILRGRPSSKACYNDEETLKYSCNGILHGPPENICKNGEWMIPAPIDCEDFTCDIPTDDSFATLDPRKSIYNAREEVKIMCVAGYKLEGPRSAICEPQGWNPLTIPKCFKTCKSPEVQHGRAQIGSPMIKGDTATVVCDDGYVIHVGQSHWITCGDNGEWEHIPQCVKDERSPERPLNDL